MRLTGDGWCLLVLALGTEYARTERSLMKVGI